MRYQCTKINKRSDEHIKEKVAEKLQLASLLLSCSRTAERFGLIKYVQIF